MNLTTLTRVKKLLDIEGTAKDNLLTNYIVSESLEIEKHLGRHVLQESRTETYTVETWENVVWLKGYPVKSSPAPQFRSDFLRQFTGSAIDATMYDLNLQRGRVYFDRYRLNWGPGTFQAIYTGGLALTAARLKGGASGGALTYTVGEVVSGSSSGASGKFVSEAGGIITLTVDFGLFEVGDVLTGATSGATRNLTSITETPLVMAFPDIALACEEQVAYLYKQRDHMGLSSISAEGGSVSFETPRGLIPQVQRRLVPYVRKVTQP